MAGEGDDAAAAPVERRPRSVTRIHQFNDWLAGRITAMVGTMACAWAFAALALVMLPDAIKAGRPAIIQWIAQTFLQLVLLSIILVGQSLQADKAATGRKHLHDHLNDVHAHIEAATGVEKP